MKTLYNNDIIFDGWCEIKKYVPTEKKQLQQKITRSDRKRRSGTVGGHPR